MGPLDAANHLLNLFAVPLLLAGLAAGLAKLAWRRELAARRWWALAWPAALAGAVVTVASLALWGRDGTMAGYAVLVAVNAGVLWWRGFARRRGAGRRGRG